MVSIAWVALNSSEPHHFLQRGLSPCDLTLFKNKFSDYSTIDLKLMPILSFHQVCKDYQQQRILDKITFEVESGEFFGLVGVNGAGKTTLIKSMLDFCDITSGTIKLFNILHTHPQARSQLAFLPEQFLLPHYLTGKNFLTYIVELYGLKYDPVQAEILCQNLDLAPSALFQTVRHYSKGMMQKLGLIACLLPHKPLVIWDEPMSGLDPKARAYFKRYLLELKTKGQTLFFSTHLLIDVESLCDRMAILHEGRLKFVGTPSQCCAMFHAPTLEHAYLTCIESNQSG